MPKEERRKFIQPTELLCLHNPNLCLFRFQKVATIFQMPVADTIFLQYLNDCRSFLGLILLPFYGHEISNEQQSQHKVIIILAYFIFISDHMHMYIYYICNM